MSNQVNKPEKAETVSVPEKRYWSPTTGKVHSSKECAVLLRAKIEAVDIGDRFPHLPKCKKCCAESKADSFSMALVTVSTENANCIHCKAQFKLTPYKVRKHYYVCDSCVKHNRDIRIAAKAAQGSEISKAEVKALDAAVQAQAQQTPVQSVQSMDAQQAQSVLEQLQSQSLAKAARIGAQRAKGKSQSIVEKLAEGTAEAAEKERQNEVKVSASDEGESEYIAQNGEVEELERAVKSGLHSLLTGPTGCGKTHLAYHVAKKLGMAVYEIPSGSGATYERIVAKDTLTEQNGVTITKRQTGILPKAMEAGAILYTDEPNSIPQDVLFCMFSSMDGRRSITFDDGTVIKAKKGFCVIGAMNEGAGYGGTQALNMAFRRRTQNIIDMEYLPQARESKLLIARTGIDKETADKLTVAAKALRAALLTTKTLKTPIDTGSLLACCTLIVNGASVHSAIKTTIVNRAPSTSTERKAISDVIAAHFGKGK